jgi:hypothetical protein
MSKKITDAQLNQLAVQFGIPYRNAKAVFDIESSGNGFRKDGFPTILFEPHVFQRQTNGRFKASHPNINRDSYDTSYYKAFPDAKKNFDLAFSLDPTAAMMSTSWGLGQIMGFNHKAAGFSTVAQMVEAFKKNEFEQAKGMFNFIKSNPTMFNAVKNNDWDTFARLYNGASYKKMGYDTKLKVAFQNAKDFVASGVEYAEKNPIKVGIATVAIVTLATISAYLIYKKVTK